MKGNVIIPDFWKATFTSTLLPQLCQHAVLYFKSQIIFGNPWERIKNIPPNLAEKEKVEFKTSVIIRSPIQTRIYLGGVL